MVSYPFCVVNIFDKYYNKWFMSKEKFKKWKKEAKAYKLEVCMLTQNLLNEYANQILCENAQFGTNDICKLVTDSMVLGVFRELSGPA